MTKPPALSQKQIALRLRQLANRMQRLGVQMDYFGGFSETGKHGREMMGAAIIARQWAAQIEKQIEEAKVVPNEK